MDETDALLAEIQANRKRLVKAQGKLVRDRVKYEGISGLDIPDGAKLVVVKVAGNRSSSSSLLVVFAVLALGIGLFIGENGVTKIVTTFFPGKSTSLASNPDIPSWNPLQNSKTFLSQGYGVGSHAPAETWGGVDLVIDGDGNGFGDREGTDGAPIYATISGKATVNADSWPGGNCVSIQGRVFRTMHCHLSRFEIGNGDEVQPGTIIGRVGSTGQSSGPHLHYEVWKDGVNVNPIDYGALVWPPPVVDNTVNTATGDLTVSVDNGLYTDQRTELDAETRSARQYVASRMGNGSKGSFTVRYVLDGTCSLNGFAYTEPGVRRVEIRTCDSVGRGRAITIAAHEIGHQLAEDRYGESQRIHQDLALSEGLATWVAAKYWLGGNEDFRAYVRKQRANGTNYPLNRHYEGLGIDAMNAIYFQWASFTDFLISEYGRNKFDQVYVTGSGAPGSADYNKVYGKSFSELESEWIVWLNQ